MNQKQLERKVKYWQKILKLDHWEITCELVHLIRESISQAILKLKILYISRTQKNILKMED
ncbi:hypothetical protein LCGC14_1761830 [marine sediment metagenome]|uniref:Uncharacterized protein n=1 Tax=marine sediment metagenome TaxID=412755 RepID=A0A0F9HN55_9ZZZZ|nr:hypothetical protein [Candidatus Aminicenantes bacterium]